MKGYIVRATAAEGQVRAFAATTKELVETAREYHNTSPVATAAQGICTSQNDGGSGWCCRCGSGFYDICISPVRKDQ